MPQFLAILPGKEIAGFHKPVLKAPTGPLSFVIEEIWVITNVPSNISSESTVVINGINTAVKLQVLTCGVPEFNRTQQGRR